MIPEATLDRIRDATDIVELIREYVPLKKRGQNYIGLCPFHSEKTPSFNVNPARQIFHCFGCGKGGNAFKFLMEHEKMGFVEAVHLLAERAHIEIPRDQRRSDDAHDRIYAANLLALDYFRKALQHDRTGKPARDYIEKRGIPSEQVADFMVGYAPRIRNGLIKYARREGIPVTDLAAAGLVYTERNEASDRFTDRLIFPIRNLSGKAIAFGGRDLSGQSRAKYLNSPETPVYQKGRVLYGLYESRHAIQSAGEVLVCEGYTDLIRLHEHGFTNCVAASGTAFTPDQARLLSRYAERALLIFDADSPGMAAALRSVAVLFDVGMDVRIIAMAGGEDPDTFLAKFGADALTKRLKEALTYVEFLEAQAGSPFRSLSTGQQDHLINEIADTIRRVADPVRRDLLTQAAWTRFGVSEDLFRARLASAGPKHRDESPPPEVERILPADWRTELLQLLVIKPESRSEAAKVIRADDFQHPAQREVATLLLDPRYQAYSPDQLLSVAPTRELNQLLSSLASGTLSGPGDNFSHYVRKLRLTRLKEQSERLLNEIAAAEQAGETKQLEALTAQFSRIRREWVQLDGESRHPDHP